MKKYLPVILGLSIFCSTLCTSCFKDKTRPTYSQLLEEHEEKESTDNFLMFLIGVITVVVIYRNIKKGK
jgi:hypothetical protein